MQLKEKLQTKHICTKQQYNNFEKSCENTEKFFLFNVLYVTHTFYLSFTSYWKKKCKNNGQTQKAVLSKAISNVDQ